MSRRIILAIEGRQCILDGFSDVFPSDRRKKPLSGRIIPVIEGCRCLPERITGYPVELYRDGRVTNFMVSAALPGRGVFLRLNRRLSDLRNYRLRAAGRRPLERAPWRRRLDALGAGRDGGRARGG